MMTDADYLYSSMVQDIYHLGTVLGRKYKLIRLAYTIFMVGIVVSVLAFAAAAMFYVPARKRFQPVHPDHLSKLIYVIQQGFELAWF